MHLKTKHLIALLITALVTSHSFAKPDFDNSDIPADGKSYSFIGGCGTVVKFEPVDNVQPRYSDRRPDQSRVYTGGLLAGVLSAIPGVGLVAAVVVDVATSTVGSAISGAAAKDKDESALKEQKWDNVYWLTIKPDYGAEFTIPYEKINQRAPDAGSRVQLGSDAFDPDRKLNIYFAGNKDLGDRLGEEYLSFCYGGTHPSYPANMKVRQLVYSGSAFEWSKVDPKIQAAVDGYYAQNRAKAIQDKADAAEAAKFESR